MNSWKWRAAGAALLTICAASAAWARPKIVAHRGLYQTFDRAGLDRYSTCTAARIHPPVHPYLENTIPSMKAAARLGADWIELDVAPTADGQVVVFHDWTLDCRTNGHGEVREHRLAELKALDIGYGYTADGGMSFPFRGKGVGLMPTLEEVLHALPRQHFMINFKSRDPQEADAVAAAFRRAGVPIDARFGFYGGDDKVLERMRRLAPKAWVAGDACSRVFWKQGWSDETRRICRGGTIGVPIELASRTQGWPKLFLARMKEAGVRVVLFGNMGDGQKPAGIETVEQMKRVPRGFDGWLWVEDLWAVRGTLGN